MQNKIILNFYPKTTQLTIDCFDLIFSFTFSLIRQSLWHKKSFLKKRYCHPFSTSLWEPSLMQCTYILPILWITINGYRFLNLWSASCKNLRLVYKQVSQCFVKFLAKAKIKSVSYWVFHYFIRVAQYIPIIYSFTLSGYLTFTYFCVHWFSELYPFILLQAISHGLASVVLSLCIEHLLFFCF